ncbi:hypothetical protein ID1000_10120 [Helicobacter pylori]
MHTINVTTIKAGAVVDYLREMHERCENALNDSVQSFKIAFKKDLYAKVFPLLRQIIQDDELIDEVAFKKSVKAVLDPLEFGEFEYILPNEISAHTGFLRNFANGVLSKLQKEMQDLKKQVQNKEQSIAQLDVQIKALKGIQ